MNLAEPGSLATLVIATKFERTTRENGLLQESFTTNSNTQRRHIKKLHCDL
ncbi:MAG: hypothetical protein RI932_2005, partial [Pseudomonadota bacterium]